jgi:hypothetical protein
VANGRKSNGKGVDRWREGGRHRQRTFDRRGDRDVFRRERIRRQQLGPGRSAAAWALNPSDSSHRRRSRPAPTGQAGSLLEAALSQRK